MHFHTLSTGKLILTILAEEPELNAKQIYFRILRESGKAISYQAVHKKLILLNREGVISKNKHTFVINDSWLNEVTNLIESAKTKSSDKTVNVSELATIRQIHNYYETKTKESVEHRNTFISNEGKNV